MKKITKLLLPITIIVASIILGSFYLASQVIKQRSIEKQQEIEITNNRKNEEVRKADLENCIDEAKRKVNEVRNDYCKLDKKEIREDGSCYLSKERIDYLNERHDETVGVCFKKYPL